MICTKPRTDKIVILAHQLYDIDTHIHVCTPTYTYVSPGMFIPNVGGWEEEEGEGRGGEDNFYFVYIQVLFFPNKQN